MNKITLSNDKFRDGLAVWAAFNGPCGALDLIGTHGIAHDNGAYVAELGDGTKFRAASKPDLRNQIENYVFP